MVSWLSSRTKPGEFGEKPVTSLKRDMPCLAFAVLALATPAFESTLFPSADLITKAQATPIKAPHHLSRPHTTQIHKTAVIGKDQRQKLSSKYHPQAIGIGILGQPGKRSWSCTAFCVAPNIIATNAHCIVKNQTVGRRLDLSRTIFMLPALKNPKTKSYTHSRFSHPQYVDPKTPGLSVYSGHFRKTSSVRTQSQDWAFTKLTNKACQGRTLEFVDLSIKDLQKAAKQKRLLMIGFHGDNKMKEHLVSIECKVRSPQNRTYFLKAQRRQMAKQAVLLPHTCDSFKGSSGSPILLKTEKGLKVVGINLGSIRYERYQIRKNRYTGKVISRKKLRNTRETNMAVRPRAFLKGLERFKNETLFHSPRQLGLLQTLLKELKFYKGKIDNKWGPASKRAVTRYERKHDLAPLGLPTKELLTHIWQEIDKKKLKI